MKALATIMSTRSSITSHSSFYAVSLGSERLLPFWFLPWSGAESSRGESSGRVRFTIGAPSRKSVNRPSNGRGLPWKRLSFR